MFARVKRFARKLRRDTGGNTMMIFALGMPVFMGGAGLAVDTAQWYEWHREMQYAVDQAAMAGAWSRVGGTTGEEYKTRAQQEIDANLQVVDFEGTPTIQLSNYAGGTNNSVRVTLSATKTLPFSSMLTGSGTTINVSAQAAFEKASTYSACLIAVDPDTPGAIRFRGNAYVVARCGVAALSDDDEAIIQDGSGTFNVGYLVAAGGIDSELIGTFTDRTTNSEYVNIGFDKQQGLLDPFGELNPPAGNGIARTYACSSSTDYTADYSKTTTVVDKFYENGTSSTGPWGNPVLTTNVSSATETGSIAATATTKKGDAIPSMASTSTSIISSSYEPAKAAVAGVGCNRAGNNCSTPPQPATPAKWKKTERTTTTSGVVTKANTNTKTGTASMQPGTYTSFQTSCDTTMAPGVYVIDGGKFTIRSQDSVKSLNANGTQAGVMIVLKNGASIDINGGSNLYLRAMTTTEMITAGIPESEALKLKDMLIFEDRNSSGAGASGDKLNGNAGAVLDGTIYLPKSNINFNGTFSVVSRCLVITAKTIDIGGTASMSSFCPSGTADHAGGVVVGGGSASVRLVE